jgi:hypothetical protein
MKTIDIIRKSVPESVGYMDSIALFENGDILWEGSGSSCPNPCKPSNKLPWQDAYAMIKEGEYKGQCGVFPRFLKSIRLNEGGIIPTINPNSNHGGRYISNGIFIHCGDTEVWRGSSGCITIPPSCWDDFISKFSIDEHVRIVLRKES